MFSGGIGHNREKYTSHYGRFYLQADHNETSSLSKSRFQLKFDLELTKTCAESVCVCS